VYPHFGGWLTLDNADQVGQYYPKHDARYMKATLKYITSELGTEPIIF
jgi:hypothetical protein